MDSRSIGIFDSGLGGLTVLAELVHLLPHEDFVYLGDTARVPYGSRSKETIIRYSLENASFLVQQNIKLLVVACNTSSSYALPILKEKFSVPVIGVIEPAVESFFEQSPNSSVAVIGTRATIKSEAYPNLIHSIDPEIKVYGKACPLFVPLVEEGKIHDVVTKEVIKEYLQEIVDLEIEDVILGCTHYPLLKKAILEVYPHLRLIDSSKETAKFVKRTLIEHNIMSHREEYATIKIFLTDITDKVSFLEKLFLEKDGFLIVKDSHVLLRKKPEVKFPVYIQELSLERLIMS
ncbi:MAG: glutamate racemase [Leptospiraceae bacterium]|nr:glutamate racemase [Leptospiraceae bacterium]MDW7976295.1 glutamate racemase [Leptospiraceae bacterium]